MHEILHNALHNLAYSKTNQECQMDSRSLTGFIVAIVQLFSQKVVSRCPNLRVDSLIVG